MIEKGFDASRLGVLVGGIRALHNAGYPMEGAQPTPAAAGAAEVTVPTTRADPAWRRADVLSTLRSGLAPHYTVEREIGAGGMAKVFLAQEQHPARKVAVKVLNPELSTPVFRARFIREVELVSKLSHPHIVPILAADECLFVPQGTDGLCYYVMPYVEGASLRDRLEKEGPLPLGEALRIVDQVADALGYAHAQGIIHRDIKPENMLLSHGRVLVSDFGIARAVSAAGHAGAGATGALGTLTHAGAAIGTPGYMSPEQLVGKRTIDTRTDIYSLACVFHEMITGQPPFLDVALYDFSAALRARGENRWVVRRLARAVSRALAPEPASRFARVDEFAAALRNAARPRVVIDRLPLVGWRTGWAAAAVLVLASLGLMVRGPALDPHRVVVAGFENLSGKDELDQLGQLATQWTTDALTRAGAVEVAPWAAPQKLNPKRIRQLASSAGAGLVVLGTYHADGDSLRWSVQIVDARRGVVRAVTSTSAPISATQLLSDRIRTAVVAAVDTLTLRPER
ncbi:MAG TPA: serine/threonine-protein kinase [Gemmatimonadales bacterium]|nr:serine/threonine-protein kinase [Gemmatimonadales bacterium]